MSNIRKQLIREIFSPQIETRFDTVALNVFRFQARNNSVYREYMQQLGVHVENVSKPEEIPFLPVTLFKTHRIASFKGKEQLEFLSSTTTGTHPSRHPVYDPQLYEQSFLSGFKYFYGDPKHFIILALLPGYLERPGSSLIYMMKKLIGRTEAPESGFYLHDHEKLYRNLNDLCGDPRRILLFGVSYALLDFARDYELNLPNLLVMETGGMKGRKKEWVREELHQYLRERFHVESIHSEYGMTELFSQAYSRAQGIFRTPPWMKVLIRDAYDPFRILAPGKHGGINVIDLANLDTCSFIETSDVGILHPDGSFSVAGRFDDAELRGCNLMVQEL